MPHIIAVLDANVLFSAPLRDTLLRAAERKLYQPQWTVEILEEVRRNLAKKRKSSEAQAQRFVDTLHAVFRKALVVEDYQSLIPVMSNHVKDRHVLAAAVVCKAQRIITFNLKDFPASSLEPYGITAEPPDAFLIWLATTHSTEMVEIIQDQVRDLHQPPLTISQVLNTLAKQAPTFAQFIRARIEQEQGKDIQDQS